MSAGTGRRAGIGVMIARRIVVAFVAVALIVVIPIGISIGQAKPWQILFSPIAFAYVGVGLLIIERRPGNLVGPIVFGMGLAISAFLLVDVYVRLPGPPPGASLAAWAVSHIDPPLFMLVGGLFLTFPDGRLPSSRWRTLVAVMLASSAFALAPALEPGPLPYYPQFENPVAVPGFPWRTIGGAAYLLVVLCVAASALALVVRWRRGTVLERAQLKWVAVAALFVGAVMATYAIVFGAGRYNDVMDALVGLAFGYFAIAIGIAVLRYRLYDIDRLISRTLSWALITAVLVAIFAGLVVGLQAVLADVIQGETLAVAASTLVAFAFFQPIRRRVQVTVDRRFDRARYDADRTAVAFADRLRDQVELAGLESDMTATVASVLRPSAIGVWMRSPAREP